MMFNQSVPLIYFRIAINEGRRWTWASPPYTHRAAALTYAHIYCSHLAEDFVLLISAADAEAAERLLEQLNGGTDYRPDEQEQRRMNFIKWLIQQGKLSEDIPA
ncbi:MAG: hypothetical protein ACJ788_21595 [Ktedonobacteraceae bacterium]